MKTLIIEDRSGHRFEPTYVRPYGYIWRYLCPSCFRTHDQHDRTPDLIRLCDRCK